ncbi:uncharacterized protein B0H18DRAFT_1130077 [Fomitopsis serialis]|uniref:uncharacterized protein n=1 Tax=Fomitopsis serialis TaxID=139415 RepID=UPI0020077CF8|nr:uncharacterized protein B0H18DRAFT_1130077 [Neoantrodia serialis]KAH9910473.1 hypothetical protein B0H18DRAFT_1130077 [Neoantrodia serialis]
MQTKNSPCPEDKDVQYVGFHRVDIGKSLVHQAKLDEDGLVYCGYLNTKDYSDRSPPPHVKKRVVIDLVSSDDEDKSEQALTTASSLSSAKQGKRKSTRKSKKKPVNKPKGSHQPPSSSRSSGSTKRSAPADLTTPKIKKRQCKDEERSRNQSAERSSSPSTTA